MKTIEVEGRGTCTLSNRSARYDLYNEHQTSESNSDFVKGSPSMFVLTEKGKFWNVYYHQETKVMYAMSLSFYNRGNFTVMVNPDGSPMLHENTKED